MFLILRIEYIWMLSHTVSWEPIGYYSQYLNCSQIIYYWLDLV